MCICIFSPACPRGPRVSRSAHSLSSETLKGVFPECIRLVYVPISTVSGGILHVRVASCTSWIHSNLIKPPRRSLVFSLSHCLHPFSSANRSRPNFCGLAKIYAPPPPPPPSTLHLNEKSLACYITMENPLIFPADCTVVSRKHDILQNSFVLIFTFACGEFLLEIQFSLDKKKLCYQYFSLSVLKGSESDHLLDNVEIDILLSL